MIQNMKITPDWEASVDLKNGARLTIHHIKSKETFNFNLSENGFDVINQWTEDSAENFKALLKVDVRKIR